MYKDPASLIDQLWQSLRLLICRMKHSCWSKKTLVTLENQTHSCICTSITRLSSLAKLGFPPSWPRLCATGQLCIVTISQNLPPLTDADLASQFQSTELTLLPWPEAAERTAFESLPECLLSGVLFSRLLLNMALNPEVLLARPLRSRQTEPQHWP